MRITDLFIRRPVMTTLVMLASEGLGLDEVVGAMETGNLNLPTGLFQGPAACWCRIADALYHAGDPPLTGAAPPPQGTRRAAAPHACPPLSRKR